MNSQNPFRNYNLDPYYDQAPEYKTCPACDGEGVQQCSECDRGMRGRDPCDACNAEGVIPCYECNGNGEVELTTEEYHEAYERSQPDPDDIRDQRRDDDANRKRGRD